MDKPINDGCGYCANEKTCKIREKALDFSGTNFGLYKTCGKYKKLNVCTQSE